MNIDPPPPTIITIPQSLLFGLSTPTLPPSPHLSAEDPIGDALTTIFQAIAGPSRMGHGLNNKPLTAERWYEYTKGDAHIWMDIPLGHLNPDAEVEQKPAKYLKAMLEGGTPTLLGCHGQDQEVYSELLYARPFHAAGSWYRRFEDSLNVLKNPFDTQIKRSLLFLGDLGVLGDVYQLRSIPLRREGLLR
jgi:hypothetical protein